MRNLKRALSLAMASVMLFGMMVVGSSAASYPDVDVADNLEAIEVLKAVGIMKGDEKGNFNPDKMVTRNEMAAIMVNLLGLTPGGSSPFYDVPEWAKGYVAACYNNDIIAGISATQFNGDANVTAVQAGLMVMKALGYFGYQGEFGDSWKLAVVKQADKIDLYRGVNAYTDQDMTRNDVAQMVLNALECTVQVVTEKGGMSVTGEGISVIQQPEYEYTDAKNRDAFDYSKDVPAGSSGARGLYETLQLCEKLYGKELIKDGNALDDFNRNATQWTYRASTVKTTNEPTLIYTKAVKLKDIYNDLGRPTNAKLMDSTNAANCIDIDGVAGKKANGSSSVYVTQDATTISASATYALNDSTTRDLKVGSAGATTYVYLNRSTGEVNIAVVNNYVGEVTRVAKNDDDKYDVTLSAKTRPSGLTDRTIEVAAETFAKGDMVLYTGEASASGEVRSITKLEEVSGEVTAVKSGDYFKLDNTQYSQAVMGYMDLDASNGPQIALPGVESELTAYVLDGVVYAVQDVDAAKDFLYVTDCIDGIGGVTANVIFSDGTEADVKITNVDDNKGNTLKTTGANPFATTLNTQKVFSYTENNGEYTLRTTGMSYLGTPAADANEGKIEKGSATVYVTTPTTGPKTVDSETIFVDVDNNKSYTGYKNVPSFSGTKTKLYWAAKGSNGNIAGDIVFIVGGTGVNDDEIIFYVKDASYEVTKPGNTTYYTYDVYMDGSNDTQKLTVSSNVGTLTANTLYVSKNVNDDGYVTEIARYQTVATTDLNAPDAGNVLSLSGTVLQLDATTEDLSGAGKSTFTFNGDTEWFVVRGKADNTVDTVEFGSSSDVVVHDATAGNGAESTVYILAVDDKTDETPLATCIMVCVPYVA